MQEADLLEAETVPVLAATPGQQEKATPAMVGHFVVIAALFAFAGGRLRQRPI